MANSYPRRDQASGIWKINQITKNIKDQGTYPQTSNQNTGLYGGGDSPSSVNTIDTVQINTAGNAVDFGDLIVAASNPAANGSFTRGIYSNGYSGGANINIIQYVDFKSQGNMADFGDSTISGRARAGGGNNIRSLYGGGFVSGNVNTIDFITNATTGNATDFGDRTEDRNTVGGAANTTRFLMAGGSAPSTVIDFVEISTTGNATDFGDLTVARLSAQAFASATRCVFAGGQPAATVDYVEFGSLGNATDFGDLAVDVAYQGTTSNSIRGIVMGGSATPSDSTKKNDIQMLSIATRANATDFGDLTSARNNGYSCSNGHGGLQESQPRAPELYSPTGKPLASGSGVGNIGLFMGGQEESGDTIVGTVSWLNIPTTGNFADFGNLINPLNNGMGTGASTTRSIAYAGYTPVSPYYSGVAQYNEFSTKGNYATFGDIVTDGYALAYGMSGSSTRAIFSGSYVPSSPHNSDQIAYVTMATLGNASDFGNLLGNNQNGAAASNSTRGLTMGGYSSPARINVIQYVTIASTGNATDFGDLTEVKDSPTGGSSSTRAVCAGGNSPTQLNIIDYVTTASTGNAQDFGDLTVARSTFSTVSNSLRAVFMGGSTPSYSNVVDYITIASTGNAIDYGDLASPTAGSGGSSNGHGGLS